MTSAARKITDTQTLGKYVEWHIFIVSNLCQYRRCVFSQNYRENAVRNAKSGIFKEKTLSRFMSGQNFSTITVSDLFYSHKKYG
jgi:hypothetical protein